MFQCFDAINDSISIEYVNMNTHKTIATEWVPVDIAKTNSISQTNIYNSTLQIFPNPVHDHFYIQFNEQKNTNYNLNIYNTSGKLCAEKSNIHQSSEITTTNLCKGLYYIVVLSNDGAKYDGNLVVE